MIVRWWPPARGPRRARRIGVVLVVLGGVLAACNGSSSEDAPTPTVAPAAARTLVRVAIDEWPECLNPLTCDTPALRHGVLVHVLPRLMALDAAAAPVPSPVLAGAPEVSPDGLTVTYRLAPDARWSDGRPITSTDIRATWQAILATPGADRTGYDRIAAVDDRDPRTAIVQFVEPYERWTDLFGGSRGWVLEADRFGADDDLSDMFLTELPMAAGPFRLADWDSQSAVLVANEGYWVDDDRARVEQVQLSRIDDRVDTAIDDGVDLVVRGPDRPGSTPAVGYQLVTRPTTAVVGLWFDQRGLLADDTLRRVVDAAIDRDALVAAAFADDGRPTLLTCAGWLPAVGEWCDPSDLPGHPAQPDLAQFALVSDGWTRGPDGIQARGGERLSLPVSFDPASPRGVRIVTAVAEALAAVGIEVVRTPITTDQWRSRAPDAPDSGVGVFSVELGLDPTVDELYSCDGLDAEPPTTNLLAWCPDELTDEVARIRTAEDPAARLEAARRIGDLVASEHAWLPLYQDQVGLLVRVARVTVPAIVPFGDGPLAGLHQVALVGGP